MTRGARARGKSVPARASEVTTRDGVRIAVHVLSPGTRPLLLAHATGLHGRVWAPLAGRLSGDLTCVAPDLRGHGDSAPPPDLDFDWRGFAADLLAAMDALLLERPLGMGHSSGATALLLAEQARPGTFNRLYCYEPVIVPAEPPIGRDPDSWLAERARRRRSAFPSAADALRHYRERPPFSRFHTAALAAYVEHGLEEDPGGGVRLKCRPEHEALVYEMATAHDAFPRLAEVRCPVTLARGAVSDAYPPGLFDRMAERLPDPRIEVLDDLSHLGPLEDPGRIAESVSRAFVIGEGEP